MASQYGDSFSIAEASNKLLMGLAHLKDRICWPFFCTESVPSSLGEQGMREKLIEKEEILLAHLQRIP